MSDSKQIHMELQVAFGIHLTSRVFPPFPSVETSLPLHSSGKDIPFNFILSRRLIPDHRVRQLSNQEIFIQDMLIMNRLCSPSRASELPL
jgi:hypothetical protein